MCEFLEKLQSMVENRVAYSVMALEDDLDVRGGKIIRAYEHEKNGRAQTVYKCGYGWNLVVDVVFEDGVIAEVI